MPRKRTTPESRFWQHVVKTDGCWLWTGPSRKNGYGRLQDGDRSVLAHRLSYTMHVGPIPAGLLVCHSCDTPACVRPDHLFLGTYLDNAQDSTEKGRRATGLFNGAVRWPECMPHGDRNGSRLHPESVQRGERHKLARLTLKTVREIKRRYWAGEGSQAGMAREHGVTQATIWRIVHGRAWPHA